MVYLTIRFVRYRYLLSYSHCETCETGRGNLGLSDIEIASLRSQ